MVRFVMIAILLVVLAITLLKLVSGLRQAKVDWTGVAFALGFVALGFYLRHATGMG